MSDAQNALRWEWPLEEAFGANGPNENPSGLGAFAFNLRFPGQYFDAETGMHYSYRDYDPAIGRYVQSDPIGLGGGVNTFSYAGQRPILSADPYGLFEILWKANSFEEYTKRPGWVRALEDYKQRLQAKINALCEGDRQEMQLYFDGWKVGFLAQETDPTTSYRTKTTTLTSPVFRLSQSSMEPLNQYAVLLHEFRHIMEENQSLYPGDGRYLMERAMNRAKHLPYEQDADRFAATMQGSCTCGVR